LAEPSVRLIAHTAKPFDVAVASARTCYSPKLVLPEEVTDGQRERIGTSIWDSGHHTPFQHATFTFGLENVSRQLVWSFLHSHPYYNSDQNSQRYVALTEVKAYRPDLDGRAAEIYDGAVSAAWNAYADLASALKERDTPLMSSIGKVKGLSEKQVAGEAEKKAIEMARYALPVAAFTSLYHTISGVVLMRYARMAGQCDCPEEARFVVGKMLGEVSKVDPNFVKYLKVEPLARREMLPNKSVEAFNAEFDKSLSGHTSRLVSFDRDGEAVVAGGVREALGKPKAELPDKDAIDLAVNPAKNRILLDALNTWQNSPVARALNLVSYTFRKRISHAADSQDQRHRTAPAARPLLSQVHTRKPDYITPGVIAGDPDLKEKFDGTMAMLWDAKNALIAEGVPAEDAVYLLPNATALRFTETGRFIDLMHKWRMRTCFNAQEEIFSVSRDELMQVSTVHPNLARYVGPPCFFRRGLAGAGPKDSPCTEGPRWCGIQVWLNFPDVQRPF